MLVFIVSNQPSVSKSSTAKTYTIRLEKINLFIGGVELTNEMWQLCSDVAVTEADKLVIISFAFDENEFNTLN